MRFSTLCQMLTGYQIFPPGQDFSVNSVQLYTENAPENTDILFLSNGPVRNPGCRRILSYMESAAPEAPMQAAGPAPFPVFFNAVILQFTSFCSSSSRLPGLIGKLARVTTLQQHLELTGSFLGMPILLADMHFSLLGNYTPRGSGSSLWQSILLLNELPFQLISTDLWQHAWHEMRSTQQPCAIMLPGTGPLLIAHLIPDGDSHLGLLVAEPDTAAGADSAAEVLAILGRLITAPLKTHFALSASHQSETDLVLDFMLRGNRYPPNTLRERLAALDWAPHRYLRVCILHSANYEADNTFFPLSELLLSLPRNLEDRALVFHSDLVLVQTGCSPTDPRSDSIAEILTYAEQYRMRIGISRCFTDLGRLYQYYQQARSALGLGSQFHPDQLAYWYEDYAEMRLLETAEPYLDLSEICHPGIQALYEADQAGGTDLVETLRNYLNHNRSISRTAAHMHIHRNTVTYRVERCLAICGADLGSLDQLLHILMSLRILEYRRARVDVQPPKNLLSAGPVHEHPAVNSD